MSCSQSKYRPLRTSFPAPVARYTQVCPGTAAGVANVLYQAAHFLVNSGYASLTSGSKAAAISFHESVCHTLETGQHTTRMERINVNIVFPVEYKFFLKTADCPDQCCLT